MELQLSKTYGYKNEGLENGHCFTVVIYLVEYMNQDGPKHSVNGVVERESWEEYGHGT